MSKPKRKTRAELERELLELRASMPSTHHFASMQLKGASKERLQASACVVQITAIGGKEIIHPVCIHGGLSQETLDGLQKDIRESWEYRTELEPLKTKNTE